ncbi:TRAP transporter large permease subunit [Pseudorhodoferax sp. Leaf274]|uniref:TRAP transporter large permease n=1 Tax=Pseudorhodoferax sp. Leaf274 TaxID=1736318 RepID=UPI000702B386|nr:TRAP transporter large permease subunit [Pseudorhodoferax sp. Leaf274]KQP45623.1 C4-dicarboxylate ABC transporter permease [Pseudorhodoferax sp. Leaf274]
MNVLRRLARLDALPAGIALALMVAIPLAEMALRPLMGRGVDNAAVLVQHLGLVVAMSGAIAAERLGHLTSLGGSLDRLGSAATQARVRMLAAGGSALLCGMLAHAGWQLVAAERAAGQVLAYGMPVWWVQACLPLGFVLLGLRLGARVGTQPPLRVAAATALPLAGWWTAALAGQTALPLAPALAVLLVLLLAGAPVFAVLGGLALALFWSEGLPLASIALSHYQITVNPSLPALPLFTLAGLAFARTGAAQRLGALFVVLFGGGPRGTVLAAALLCSAFTAFTGGSGVTILALGGLLLPLLRQSGYPEQRGIGMVTSASALGVLLAPSVPLIMYAVIARVPIETMFLAGLVPALVMVACLLLLGGYLRTGQAAAVQAPPRADFAAVRAALWAAKWEVAAPFVAIGALVSGLATPTESAALTAAYALATQGLVHRELDWRALGRCLAECAQVIGGVMLILGMALALTNFLVDAGIPELAVDWVQAAIPNKYVFLLALCAFLFVAAALMEIFAALAVLVPLLLPLALSYGLDPVHFGIIFLAAMEAGFLCPPAGMNIYFASAMFGKSIPYVARSVLPAMLAIFAGTLLIALWPGLSTGLPNLLR